MALPLLQMTVQGFNFEDFEEEMLELVRSTAKIYVKEKRKSIGEKPEDNEKVTLKS